jgi:hypothetical protein
MPKKQPDFNKRMKIQENEKKRKRKENLVIKNVFIEEVFDETGEVTENTIIKFSFDGILINLSVAAAIKMNVELGEILNLKKRK